MRPKAIVYFEWIVFGTLALGLVQDYLAWDSLIAVAGTTQADPRTFLILTQALTFGLIIVLTLLISRRRSIVAMWISIILFVLGLPMVLTLAAQGLLDVRPVGYVEPDAVLCGRAGDPAVCADHRQPGDPRGI